jgi:hypothetical protein
MRPTYHRNDPKFCISSCNPINWLKTYKISMVSFGKYTEKIGNNAGTNINVKDTNRNIEAQFNGNILIALFL